ncbi:MAG: PTS sugar transporter subunit IIC [candidate division WOR-3 bacterium]
MILLLTLFGALILLDKYAVGEFGISQPIIAGTIIGLLCGDLRTGIFIGALFQMIFLANLPIGRDVPPDAQAAGIVGCGSYFIIKQVNQAEPNLVIVFLIGMLGAVLGSALDTLVRKLNERLYYQFLRDKSCLFLCHFTGIFTSFLRGVILLLPIFVIVSVLRFDIITSSFSKEFLMIVMVALGIANGIYLFLRKQCFYFFVIGVLCALVFFVL